MIRYTEILGDFINSIIYLPDSGKYVNKRLNLCYMEFYNGNSDNPLCDFKI